MTTQDLQQAVQALREKLEGMTLPCEPAGTGPDGICTTCGGNGSWNMAQGGHTGYLGGSYEKGPSQVGGEA